MIVQLTNAGQAALDANEGVVTITSFQIGSGHGYVPQPTDTGIHGTSLFTGVPTNPVKITANVVQYTGIMDATVGPFSYGEIGLYMADGTLFALAANSTLITKALGDEARIDMYVSIISPNYEMWLSLVESNNPFRMAVLGAPDQLPASKDASPNCYVITGAADDQSAFMAYTNRYGWWNFDAYDFASGASTEVTITAVSASSVTIARSDYDARMNPTTIGDVIIEFVSGPAYSFARYVRDVIVQTNDVVLDFVSPFSILPVVGDTLVYFVRRQSPNNVPVYPVASTTALGIMQVGAGLLVTNGLVSVDDSVIPYPVKSFNGQTGVTTFEVVDANPATGQTLVVSNGLNLTKATLRTIVAGTGVGIALDTNSNLVISSTAAAYVLPVATTTVLGGVMSKAGSHITISNTGVIDLDFTPVTSVDGQTGAVTIEAQNATGSTGQTLISDSGATTGIIKLYAIKAGSGITVTQSGGDVTIAGSGYTLPTAGTGTGGVLGGVKVDGTTVTINATTGIISANSVVNVASTTVTGIVRVGQTLTLTDPATGTIDYNLPQAGVGSGGVLGGVKVDGTTITLNATTGVISASGTGVSSVNGATGAITNQVTDANTASGLSWIVSSGGPGSTSPNNPQLRRIVAGQSIAAITTDVNGNLVVGVDPSAPTTGYTNANLMINESGDLGTSNPAYLWTDSGAKVIGLQTGTSNGLFWRCNPQTVAASGTIKSPMFALGSRTNTISQMWMRTGSDSTGTFNYQVVYYNSSGTVVTSGNSSGNLPLTTNLTRLTTPVDVQDPTASQAQVVINYTTATWTTLDWFRGKVEAGNVNTAYSMEGTLDKIATLATGAVKSVSGQTGAVVISATDNNAATGTSLVVNSGSTTGAIKLKTIVAGTNIGLATDANGNLQINSTAAAYTLPVATASVLGGVKSGANVTIAADGTISVAAPNTYTLPVATSTVLGGVKQGAGTSIAVDGTISVTTVGGVSSVSTQTGAVVIQASDANTGSGTSLITNSGATTGNITLKRLVAGTNITIGADGNGNLQINNSAATYTLPAATTSVLGGVKAGSGLSVAVDGTLSVTALGGVSSVSGLTGAVTVQATDNNTATGVSLIANSGSTTANIKLLRLVAGTNTTIAPDASGNLVVSSTASGGGVTSVSTLTGAVVVQATNNNAATGTSLISDGGSTTGNIKLKTVVAGSGITLASDSNGNLLVSASASAFYYLPITGSSGIGTPFTTPIATILLTSAASAAATVSLPTTGNVGGARVVFMNASTFVMTLTTTGNLLQLRSAAATSSVAVNAGAQLEFVWTGSLYLATPTAFSG